MTPKRLQATSSLSLSSAADTFQTTRSRIHVSLPVKKKKKEANSRVVTELMKPANADFLYRYLHTGDYSVRASIYTCSSVVDLLNLEKFYMVVVLLYTGNIRAREFPRLCF